MNLHSAPGGGRVGRWNPHEILPVAPDATPAQINTAYRSALRRLHPDTHPRPDRRERHQAGRNGQEPTMEDLQAARDQLLRQATQRHATQRQGTQRDAGSSEAAGDSRPGSAPGPPPRGVAHSRSSRRFPGGLDLFAGPVRYHGRSP